MRLQQYAPRRAISYLALISEFLEGYREFHAASDIETRLGSDCLADVTETPEIEIQLLEAWTPWPEHFAEHFDEHVFVFKESERRLGIFDAVFYEHELVNFRAQMFFSGAFVTLKVFWFNTFTLRPFLNKILGIENVHHDRGTDMFYCDNFNGLTVVFRQVHGTPSVSTYIMDRDFA